MSVCDHIYQRLINQVSFKLISHEHIFFTFTDAKRAKLTPHNNHLPLQGVLVMKDTVSFTTRFVFTVVLC